MRHKDYRIVLFTFAAASLFLFTQCGNPISNEAKANSGISSANTLSRNISSVDPYFITGTKEEQDTLKQYFVLLAAEAEGSPEQFAAVREIANCYVKQKNFGTLICFLSSRIHEYPEDPYNAYYLFMTAYGYQQMEAYPAAALYFDMIVKNYPDLRVQERSIHLACPN